MWGGVARGEKLAECPSMGWYWDIQRDFCYGDMGIGGFSCWLLIVAKE